MADTIIDKLLYLGDIYDALCSDEYDKVINVLGWIEPDPITGYIDRKALNALAYLIHQSTLRSEKVLVHCRAGIERSPLVVVWYLYRYHSHIFPTLQDAYRTVQQARPCVQNRECWIQFKRRK